MNTLKHILVSLLFVLGPATFLGHAQEPAPRGGASSLFSSPVLAQSEREKQVLAVLADMDRTQRRGSMSVPMEDGRILRVLTETMNAKQVVERATSKPSQRTRRWRHCS